jgi:hypothetical protein
MRQILLALVVLTFASVAGAQTTTTSTSSSTSTSTSTTLVLSWACKPDATDVRTSGYEAWGKCTGSGAYQSGGAALGSAATATATARALCGSGNQTVVDFYMTPNMASGVANYYCSFSLTTFVLQCATTIGTEISTSNVTPGPFNYYVLCK